MKLKTSCGEIFPLVDCVGKLCFPLLSSIYCDMDLSSSHIRLQPKQFRRRRRMVVVVEGLTILPLTQLYRGNINLSAKKCESVSYCRPTQLYLNKPERKIIFGIQNFVIKYEKYFLTLLTSFLSSRCIFLDAKPGRGWWRTKKQTSLTNCIFSLPPSLPHISLTANQNRTVIGTGSLAISNS